MGLTFADLVRLAGQRAQGLHISASSIASLCHNAQLFFSYVGSGEANSSPRVCKASCLPSPAQALLSWVTHSFISIPIHVRNQYNCLTEASQQINRHEEFSGGCNLSRYLPGCFLIILWWVADASWDCTLSLHACSVGHLLEFGPRRTETQHWP